MAKDKRTAHKLRQKRIRKNVQGVPERPRLAVHRSLKRLYAQIIDDTQGKTLLGLSTASEEFKSPQKDGGNVKGAKALGMLLARKALEQKIEKVVFDRSGFLYHGRIKAFADGAREGGLKF